MNIYRNQKYRDSDFKNPHVQCKFGKHSLINVVSLFIFLAYLSIVVSILREIQWFNFVQLPPRAIVLKSRSWFMFRSFLNLFLMQKSLLAVREWRRFFPEFWYGWHVHHMKVHTKLFNFGTFHLFFVLAAKSFVLFKSWTGKLAYLLERGVQIIKAVRGQKS